MTQGSESTRPDRPGPETAEDADTVLHRFEAWAADSPDAPAVIASPDDTLTYGQLDAEADRMAGRLLAAGLPAGGLVAVGTDRPAELLVALLAVLKAGGAYAVIDVDDPRTGRRQLTAITPYALLTHPEHHARLDNGRALRVIGLGEAESAEAEVARADRPAGPPPRPDRPAGAGGAATAAVLFTGSAEPRPVPIGHARLLAACEAWAQVAASTAEDRHLITARPDITAFAAGWTRALCTGGALVVPPRSPWRSEDVRAAVRTERVTVLYTDPAGAERLLIPDDAKPPASVPRARREPEADLRSLRLVAVTGDRLHLDRHETLAGSLRTGARLLNVYGLTETAGTGTWFELPQLPGPLDDMAELSLLGTPFPGCLVGVRDREIRLTPPDGGDAIPTGDLGLLRPDGLLEFGGRIRDRITLDDGRSLDPYPVESAIRSHAGIGGVIVKGVDGSRGPRRLVAYVAPPAVGEAPHPWTGLPDVEELRGHLAGKVPREDIPRGVVRLRALPRDRAGREDRDALPLPILPAASAKPTASRSGSGKYGAAGGGEASSSCAVGCAGIALAVATTALTDVFWPGSTDLTGVPAPWAFLFFVLYLFEAAAFSAGVLFFFGGRERMLRQGRGRALTTAAHLAVVYLLVSWWPQDNFYRLAAKQDFPRQAALVYAFNVPLMIAGLIVALYVTRKPASPFDFDD